jgi:ArsR family transcriptional regulator, nickel/cobalt-responsive transcriptional repressor
MSHGIEGRTTAARLDMEGAHELATVMQALAAPSRLLILGELRRTSRSVGDLAEAVGMSPTAVSQQLRILRHLHLVVARREGRHMIYTLHDEHVGTLLDEAQRHVEHIRLATSGRTTAA